MPFLKALQRRLARPSIPLWLAALAMLVTAPSLWGGFAIDDHYLRMVFQGCPGLPGLDVPPLEAFTFADGDPEHNRLRMNLGLLPWWALEHVRFAFWRPLSALIHWADHVLWGDLAWPMHLESLLVYAAIAFAVTTLYRRLMTSAWVAGLAGLLYVVDDAHGIPAAWLANRNALLVVLFGVLTLLAHHRWRRGGHRSAMFAALGCLAAGLACGEGAVAVGGYLAAYAVSVEVGPWPRRLGTLAPYAAIVLVWRVLYKGLGFGITGSAIYLDPAAAPHLFAIQAAKHAPLLLLGQFAAPDPILHLFLPPLWRHTLLGAAILFLAFTSWIVWPLVKRSPMTRFWTLGMVLSLLPACATVPQNRLLLYPGIGAMALVAHFLATMAERPAWLPQDGRWRAPAATLALAWVALHLVLAPFLLAATNCAMTILGKEVERANATVSPVLSSPAVVAGKDQEEYALVIVTSPSDVVAISLPVIRSSLRQPLPSRCWLLTAGNRPVEVRRVDRQTLVIRPDQGAFLAMPWAQMFRRPDAYPMRPGQTIALNGLDIEVRQVTEDGRPTEVRFRFDRPLEDPALRWVAWEGRGYVPFTPPGIGESVRLPGLNMPQWLRAVLRSRATESVMKGK